MGDARTRVDFGKVCIEQVDSPFSDDEDLLVPSLTSYESEEDLSSSLSDSQELVELDGDTPLVFLDTETNGLFKEDDPLYVPEMLQICVRYKNRTFDCYIQPTVDIEDEASYVNGLTIINGRLCHHGGVEVPSVVGLSECLHSLLLWLKEVKESADERKPILLAHNGFGFHFKILCHTLDMCNLREEADLVIGGFADTLDLARKFIPEDRVRNYQLRSLAVTFFNMFVPNEAKAQAQAIQKIFKKHLCEHFHAEEVYTFNNFCNSFI